jgi:hypothetical protein
MANFRHIPCGSCVNESERKAIECMKGCLQCAASGPWLLLSNLNHSVSAQRRSDEIDGVLIGPPGVVVIEVKHWDQNYPKDVVEAEAVRRSLVGAVDQSENNITTKAGRWNAAVECL